MDGTAVELYVQFLCSFLFYFVYRAAESRWVDLSCLYGRFFIILYTVVSNITVISYHKNNVISYINY